MVQRCYVLLKFTTLRLFMVHLYRLVLLVLPLMTGFAQSDPSPGKSPNKSPQYPHANQ